jgi:PqqA peptide cyclase
MKIFFVAPDYHEGKPKKCMNGWGNVFLTIAPDGAPCPATRRACCRDYEFPTVRERSLKEIWYESEGFNRYRGTGWMKEPCVSCPDKQNDLGGCRCQAYLLAQDPQAADPVCPKSPDHGTVTRAVAAADADQAPAQPIVFRDRANSLKLCP